MKELPIITMYNQYFGGSMNAIVFQEMREKRSLAYTAQSRYVPANELNKDNYNFSYIATQNDKVIDAFTAFDELFNDMPQSQPAFDLVRERCHPLKPTVLLKMPFSVCSALPEKWVSKRIIEKQSMSN